jgi:hypothetical protein
MCPAGRPPAAVNASSCGDAAAEGNLKSSTILYSVIGSLLAAGLLATFGTMLVLRRRRSISRDKSCADEKAEVVASNMEYSLMGLPVKLGGLHLLTYSSYIAYLVADASPRYFPSYIPTISFPSAAGHGNGTRNVPYVTDTPHYAYWDTPVEEKQVKSVNMQSDRGAMMV